jgi:hypothetical protein
VRLVVRRVGVLAVPAAGEVNLGPNSTRTLLRRELVVPRGLSVEVETKERHGLLSEAAGIVGAEGCVSTDHPEIIRERSRRSWLIIEEVVNDSSSGERLEGSVVTVEVKVLMKEKKDNRAEVSTNASKIN